MLYVFSARHQTLRCSEATHAFKRVLELFEQRGGLQTRPRAVQTGCWESAGRPV